MFSQSPGPRVGFHTCLPDNTSNAPYLIPIFYKTIVPDISLNINHYMILKKLSITICSKSHQHK